MKLFASLYLDEDFSVLIAALLEAQGFDVTTARDEGMLGKSDPEQLEFASNHGRCIVTHNRVHFEQLHREYLESERHHWGIIISAHRRPYEIARRLARLLNALTADEIADNLFYV